MIIPQVHTYRLSEGIDLSFTDSGAPPESENYTTLLAIHGGLFNAHQFHKLHSCAHMFNLRVVLLHRRDYLGSTPYSATERQELEEGSKSFWERLSAQLVEFLCIFIEREKIPQLTLKSGGVKSGGITILGWSLGATLVVSFLGCIANPMISDDVYLKLAGYVGHCILYEPTYLALGYSPPSDHPNYLPWADPSLSPEQISKAVLEWISSYYDHPCYDPGSHSLPSLATIDELDGTRSRGNKTSIDTWTAEELSKGIETENTGGELLTFLPKMQETLCMLTEQALFDGKSIQSWFPMVDVSYIGGTRTNWICAWAQIETKKRVRCLNTGRRTRFLDLDGLNHFAHWDQPQVFLQAVAQSIDRE